METTTTQKKNRRQLADKQAASEIMDPVQSSSMEEDVTAPRKENKTQHEDLGAQVSALKNEVSELRGMVEEIESLIGAVKDLMTERDSGQHPQETTPSESPTVAIGPDGQVEVSVHCLERAKAQRSATGMALTLLLGLFSVEVLLKSYLKLDPSVDAYQPLDSQKLEALIYEVIQRHPKAKEVVLRDSIRNKIYKLRQEKKGTTDSGPSVL